MNIIHAIYHIVTSFDGGLNSGLSRDYHGFNRANQMGGALEEWVKDIFADTLHCVNESDRLQKLNQVFSYLGNQNNPPDMILKNGDAIEVKKLKNKDASLALNSSYPKDKLYANSSFITQSCRNCETDWAVKDVIYVVGIVPNSNLHSLCMVYGEDYCASQEIYERVRSAISHGVYQIEGIEFSPSKELAKVKKIDPLGITDLRVRGMWSISSPFKVFEYIYQRDYDKCFNFMGLINLKKYQSFDNTDLIENLVGKVDGFNIQDVMIKNPNNPARLTAAKLIGFKR